MEKMQQRAEQHEQPWEHAEEMGRVLGDQEKRGNGQEDQ
jgi:hypothetical protein